MLFSSGADSWNDIVNQTYDIEFDFLAVDNLGQLAVFSTFNRGYKPACVTQSFEQFLLLDQLLETLPNMTTAIYARQDNKAASFNDWKRYAELGFFAYDNQDVHRTEQNKQNQYDIIYKPTSPLHFRQIAGLDKFVNIVPRFDLTFGDVIKFDNLQSALID